MDVLLVKNLVKRFGGLCAVDGVSLSVAQGEVLGLIGPNGAGKTTLFNTITGVYPANEGEILFMGETILGLKPHRTCRKGIGRTFQVPKPLMGLSVLDNVMVACFPKSKSKKEAREKAEEKITLVGLDKEKMILAKHLTLANKKRLEMARALSAEPSLLLLDEVMAGLNEIEINEAISLIRKIMNSNISIIVIEHIFKVIMKITDRVAVLDHGKKISEGDPHAVINEEEVIKAYFGEDYAFA